MNEAKHTPGSWRKGRDDMTTVDDRHGWSKAVYVDDPRGGIHKPTGEPLPFTVGKAYGETEEEAHTNAAMFAAAPDLLAALRLARAQIQAVDPKMRDGATPVAMEAADRAIAKATGGAS